MQILVKKVKKDPLEMLKNCSLHVFRTYFHWLLGSGKVKKAKTARGAFGQLVRIQRSKFGDIDSELKDHFYKVSEENSATLLNTMTHVCSQLLQRRGDLFKKHNLSNDRDEPATASQTRRPRSEQKQYLITLDYGTLRMDLRSMSLPTPSNYSCCGWLMSSRSLWAIRLNMVASSFRDSNSGH